MATIELSSGYSFEANFDGQSGQRVFVTDPIAASPVSIGDQHPDSAASRECICRSVKKTMYGGDARKAKWVCSYSTSSENSDQTTPGTGSGTNGGGSSGTDPEFLPKGFELAGEFVDVKAPQQWRWHSDAEIINFEGESQPVLTKRIITGAMTVEKLVRNFSVGTYVGIIGRVGQIPFVGGGTGNENWLCSGISAQEAKDQWGNPRWKLRATFLLRSVDGTSKGWNHIWRPDKGKWDKPVSISGQINLQLAWLYDISGNMMEIFRDW